uniref:DUF1168 domain-containing protein n=3 Tax=Ditylum brightwellii TaxID=49249 RepID=A0A6S9D7T2_9STRA|mmetsp:Transcript_47951/g.72536  ORF Transcript_47951/g.72536 Transcript_47951/m.72536 type:complete len:219 (+) Transcript_47951:129-785(+)
MGRYTTVQAYADNNPNMRSVSYDQATGKTEPSSSTAGAGAVKPEKVDNPYGSTAGAGSGEFHVYRHARSREMARMAQLEYEEKQQLLHEDFEKRKHEMETEEERKTAKRRKKRMRGKESKMRKKNMKLGGVGLQEDGTGGENLEGGEEEFEYTPTHRQIENKGDNDDAEKIEFKNDGSFLEMMKKKLAAEAAGTAKQTNNGNERGDENDLKTESKETS